MKILIGDMGNIDFDSPVRMSEEQKVKFIKLLREIYYSDAVEVMAIGQFRDDRLGDKKFFKSWDEEVEYPLLFEMNLDNSDVGSRLGRSEMSIRMTRGPLIPEWLKWCEDNNHDPNGPDKKELIKQFIKEQHDRIISNRNKRKEEKTKIKQEIEEKEYKLSEIKSEINSIEYDIKKGLKNKDPELKALKNKKIELENELRNLKK